MAAPNPPTPTLSTTTPPNPATSSTTIPLPNTTPLPADPQKPIRSWKDVCESSEDLGRLYIQPDLFTGKVKVEFPDGPLKTPLITFDSSILEALEAAWCSSIIFRPLGTKISYELMARKVRSAMKIRGKFRICDLPNGFFLLKLQSKEDFDRILTEGPWCAFGHYLAVRPWSAEFDPQSDKISLTPIWVRINKLPMIFYEENTLLHIFSGIGEPLKVDSKTLFADRGRFARVCAFIDLAKPLINSVIVQGIEYQVEYENLTAICISCGLFGHFKAQCPNCPESKLENASNRFKAIAAQRKEEEWRAPTKKAWVPKIVHPADESQAISQIKNSGRFDVLTLLVDSDPASCTPGSHYEVSHASDPAVSVAVPFLGTGGMSDVKEDIAVSPFLARKREEDKVDTEGYRDTVCLVKHGDDANPFGVLSGLAEDGSAGLDFPVPVVGTSIDGCAPDKRAPLPVKSISSPLPLGPASGGDAHTFGKALGCNNLGVLGLDSSITHNYLGPPLKSVIAPSSLLSPMSRSPGLKKGFLGPMLTRAKARATTISQVADGSSLSVP